MKTLTKKTPTAQSKHLYSTASLNNASVLMATDVLLAGHGSVDGVVVFQFEQPDRARAILRDFMAGTLTVNARRLVDAFSMCRDAIRNSRQGGEA